MNQKVILFKVIKLSIIWKAFQTKWRRIFSDSPKYVYNDM
jgi:hypothetical protein